MFELRLGADFGGSTNGGPIPYIFEGLTLGAADVGTTFVISQANGPDYDALVAMLINGRSSELA